MNRLFLLQYAALREGDSAGKLAKDTGRLANEVTGTPEWIKKKRDAGMHHSGDIFSAVTFHGEKFFYPVAVVALEFD